MFDQRAGFRKVDVVASDREISVEVHRIFNGFNGWNRETRRRRRLDERHNEVFRIVQRFVVGRSFAREEGQEVQRCRPFR